MSLETVQTDRLLGISQDRLREFIILMTTISIAFNILLLVLIYQDILRILQDS